MGKCNHAYSMIYDDDFCCCTKCHEQWHLGSKGWVPVNMRPQKKPNYYNRNKKKKK